MSRKVVLKLIQYLPITLLDYLVGYLIMGSRAQIRYSVYDALLLCTVSVALSLLAACKAHTASEYTATKDYWDGNKQQKSHGPGFFVSNGRLFDGANQEFVIRGVANPHIWYPEKAMAALPVIASYGFNAVRIIWETNGKTKELDQIIARVVELKMVPILELHDYTGSDDTWMIGRLVDYYLSVDVKALLVKYEQYLMLNVANEWGSGFTSANTWRDTYQQAVRRLRQGGIQNVLIIDSRENAQDPRTLKNYAKAVMDSDPNGNLLFSLHIYGLWGDATPYGKAYPQYHIYPDLDELVKASIPFMIGEFGYNHQNGQNNLSCVVDANAVMRFSRDKNIGYIAWEWFGDDDANKWLDMSSQDNNFDLTAWGKQIIYSPDIGVKATSRLATTLVDGKNTVMWNQSSSQTKAINDDSINAASYISGSNSSSPTAQSYPECQNPSISDPNQTGWGWENNKSCRVFPKCTSAAAISPSNPTWGWENNASCKVNANSGS